jgi:hypothetical protein
MEKKLKIFWSVIILICMLLVIGHLIWSAQTSIFSDKNVIEQTFTKRQE